MRRNSALAALADIVGIVLFCVIGRRSDAEGLTAAGVAETAWPFLMGTAVGWLAARAWRRPTAVVPTGVVVWLCTIVVGMLARRATSAGVAVSFVIVASVATAVLLLGWRLLAAGIRRRGLNIDQDRAAAATFDALMFPQAHVGPKPPPDQPALPPVVCWLPSPGAEPAKYCPAQTTRIEYVDDKGQWVQKDIGTGANEVIMNGELPGVEYLPGPPTGQAAPGTTDRLWPEERGNLVHERHESAGGPPKIEVLPPGRISW